MTPDGMMMYRPPPMMPYHPYHMPQPGVMPPFVSSIAPPPQYGELIAYSWHYAEA